MIVITIIKITRKQGVSFLMFYYTDFSDTLDNSIILAECVLDGDIWNLPVIMEHRLMGYNYMYSLRSLLWCKTLILVALIFCAIIIQKYCNSGNSGM